MKKGTSRGKLHGETVRAYDKEDREHAKKAIKIT
jgi:hypothetical protein